jgi:hypothetical protein
LNDENTKTEQHDVPSHVHTPDEIAYDLDVDPETPAKLYHVMHVADRTTTLSTRITRLEEEHDNLEKAFKQTVVVLVILCLLVDVVALYRRKANG